MDRDKRSSLQQNWPELALISVIVLGNIQKHVLFISNGGVN
jgi:hypothetical protein